MSFPDTVRRRGWVLAGVGLGLLCSSVCAYYQMFTGFAEWDDEGTLMMTVRQFLSGGRLYDNVKTHYGPVYYWFNWAVRGLSFTPVTHDVTRFTSTLIWSLCAAAAAWLVWRFGRSAPTAIAAHLVIFQTISFFANEPGHPQELCLILILALAGSGLAAAGADGPRSLAAMLPGALAAALLLVKVNIGVFAITAVGLAGVVHLSPGGAARALRWMWGALALVVPYGLMRNHLDDPRELAYCAAVTSGIAGLLAALRRDHEPVSWRFCLTAAGAFAATCGLVLLSLTIIGTSAGNMLYATVLEPFSSNVGAGRWFFASQLEPGWIAWAATAPIAAIAATQWSKRSGRAGVPAPLLIGFGTGVLLLAAVTGDRLFGFATPFCWLVAYPPMKERPGMAYARTLLAATATLQTLYAFPVAGSQAPFAHVLLIVCGGICLADGLRALAPSVSSPAFARAAGAAAIAVMAASYPIQAWRAGATYERQVPLHMPGAERVRAAADEVAVYRWLVRLLKQNCDTFAGYPGTPSLYFWTGMPMPGPAENAPGPLNTDAWTLLYTPEEQNAVVQEFQGHANACVVYHPSGVAFWNRSGEDLSGQPLVSFIQTHFRTVAAMGDYQLQVRNERPEKAIVGR